MWGICALCSLLVKHQYSWMLSHATTGSVAAGDSMFAIKRPIGRRRRQVSEPSLDFIFPDPPAPFSIDNLNYTDEQREFCNNDVQCMFDLLFTGDTQVAMTTMNVNEEGTRQAKELSKNKTTTQTLNCVATVAFCSSLHVLLTERLAAFHSHC